jgi:NADH-quinone oxidoreductase subunit E
MSFRRLHPEQPESFAFTPENLEWARKVIARYPAGREASAVIPLLWRAQEQNGGWVTEPMIRYIADMLRMKPIRVLEIATFYTMFQLRPVGRKAHVQVCGTTPCRLRGAEELLRICRRRIAEKAHTLSDDGDFSWEEVECLGACANAPMVQIGEKVYEDLTPERFEEILDEIAAGKEPRSGPQNGRRSSEPLGGPTTLADASLYERGSDAAALIEARRRARDQGARTGAEEDRAMKAGSAASPAQPAAGQAAAEADRSAGADEDASGRKVTAGGGKEEPTAAGAHGPRQAEERTSDASTPAAETATGAQATAAASGGDEASGMGGAPAGVEEEGRQAASAAGAAGGDAETQARAQPQAVADEEALAASEERPPLTYDSPPEKVDDLKMISGIGPKIEKILNDLGIYTFAQIAAWGPAEIRWVDRRLRFKGRIIREKWVEQADALAAGGRDEYVRRFGKEPR